MIVLEPLIPVDHEILTGSSSVISSEKALMQPYVVVALLSQQPSHLPGQHGLPQAALGHPPPASFAHR